MCSEYGSVFVQLAGLPRGFKDIRDDVRTFSCAYQVSEGFGIPGTDVLIEFQYTRSLAEEVMFQHTIVNSNQETWPTFSHM